MNNQSTKAKELMNEPHLMNSLHQSIRLKEFSHHLTQSVFIGIPDELQQKSADPTFRAQTESQ